MPLLGSHLSIAGGLTNALDEATRLKLECVQIFTCNQRQWRVPKLHDEDAAAWRDAARTFAQSRPATTTASPDRPRDLIVAHNSYLINLASPEKDARTRSINRQILEVERCAALDIHLLVAHPGAHLETPRKRGEVNQLGQPPSRDELAGLRRIAQSLDQVHQATAGCKVITCLETTVGSGTNLGYDFQHLAIIRDMVKEPQRIAYCLDTCHVTAAGYDMQTPALAAAVLDAFDAECGLDLLRVLHLNDSQGLPGSRLDRHAHIGDGTCGKACFEAILNHGGLKHVPAILETPKGHTPRGTPWDTVNVRRLKRLRSGP
ncbi:MAG: deoxyribonuclease IV [Phycisphaerales bacterium]